MPSIHSISIHFSVFNHVRNLNIVEGTKEQIVETYEGAKNLVERNLILSISIAAVVLFLLMLCCYLRRKYARNAQAMTQAEHDRLVEEDRHKRKSKRKVKSKSSSSDKRRKGKRRQRQCDANLANTSMETKSTVLSPNHSYEDNYRATILSDTQEKKFCDIEKGGVEMKLDESFRQSIVVSPVKKENDVPKKKGRFFNRNRK